MIRRTKGLVVLGLSLLLGIFGVVLVRRGLAGSKPTGGAFEPADLVIIVGGLCGLAAILALVRAARYLIAGR